MGPYTELVQAFSKEGYNLLFENDIFLIENSEELSDKIKNVVEKILISNSREYTFSENRLNGMIAFVVKPLPRPSIFDKMEFKAISLSQKELEESLSSTPTKEVTATLLAFQNQVAMMPSRVSHLLVEFAEKANSGTVLDLGCGKGENSIYLLKKGWQATCIDRYQQILAVFVSQIDKSIIKNGQLKPLCLDIHKFDYPASSFDLVVMTNVLNYLEPKSLLGLMKKIHTTLKSKGVLIGNFCFEEPAKPNEIVLFNKMVGVHFYKKEVAAALLAHSGFEVMECKVQLEIGCDPFMIQFSAQKKE